MPDGSADTMRASAHARTPSKDENGAPRATATMTGAAQREFMKMTWVDKPRSEWTLSQKLLWRFDVLPNPPGREPAPIKSKTDKMPVWTTWQQHVHTAPWAFGPLVAHYAFVKATGMTLHPLAAYALYTASYNALALISTRRVNQLAMKYGFLDGNAKRDGVPDDKCDYILMEVLKVVLLRPLLGLVLVYDRNELPSISLLFPIKLLLWSLVLDFWFYVYHRAMHEVPWLWKYHATHHMTKHPSSLLSAFADGVQEVWDAFMIPMLTYLVMLNLGPLSCNFYECFVCMQYIITAESGGHSGARIYASSPCNSWLLRPLGMELVLEDHDIHHRHGWKNKSANYGKQTLFWDTIFGTTRARIETVPANIDWNWKI